MPRRRLAAPPLGVVAGVVGLEVLSVEERGGDGHQRATGRSHPAVRTNVGERPPAAPGAHHRSATDQAGGGRVRRAWGSHGNSATNRRLTLRQAELAPARGDVVEPRRT